MNKGIFKNVSKLKIHFLYLHPAKCLKLGSFITYHYKMHNIQATTIKIVNTSSTCVLYYKHMAIVNDDSSGISKWGSKLIDSVGVIIYDHYVFIIQATGLGNWDIEILQFRN